MADFFSLIDEIFNKLLESLLVSAHDLDDSPDYYHEINVKRQSSNIENVKPDPVIHLTHASSLATTARYLCQAGHARPDEVPAGVARNTAGKCFIQLGHVRARPNDRHVAKENVDELRNLVEVSFSQDCADTSHARIIPFDLLEFSAGPMRHRPKLQTGELSPAPSYPPLAKKSRPRRIDFDDQPDEW